ncbi:MAG TPA: alpha-L-glutamate ligase [Anaeromyxobacteraceae bacterium]|nr:alpha-L-glutamate ligase [Anaeromyxobacteraceae bacterium]
MILAVCSPSDPHARAVLGALRRLGREVVPCDLSRFPRRAALALGYDGSTSRLRLGLGDRTEVELERVRAVWWYCPPPFAPDPALSPEHREFAEAQCREAFGGLAGLLPAAWVNHPRAAEAAGLKTFQLSAAAAAGFEVPRTLVTNDPRAARAFVEELGGPGRAVHKSLRGTRRVWRETRLVDRAELRALSRVRYAPVILQEYVPGEDLRVTVVGPRIFTAAIDASASAYPLDWRQDLAGSRLAPASLPAGVAGAVRRLMRRLGLAYGAFDLRRTPEGRCLFLEVNPSGRWLFAEQRAGLPISAALADLLGAAATRSSSP